ncbi:hypothetical protein E6Q11_01715, partial [Candidatus Dojkabacteria bacterium]
MKFKNILLSLVLIPNLIFPAHVSERKIYATDITNKPGTTVLRMPTTLPTANKIAVFNSDSQITSGTLSESSLGVAGSDTQVQFNDGGSPGADSNFVWNKNNDALGVQVTPLNPLHVAAISGTTINNVTVGSVSQTAEVAAPSVTGSATAIAEFSAPANVSANRNTSGSGYSASGQTIDYQIYGLIYNGSAYYKSSNFGTVSFTDTLNDASSFSVNVSW